MIYKHEMRSNLKQFLIWTIIITGFDFIMVLLYPSLQESMADLSATYEKMGAFATAFGMDQLSLGDPMGFYGMYVGVMLSLCGAMFAAILGTGILAKEEGGHTAEYLYTLPYSRVHIVVQKLLAVLTFLVTFEVVNLVFGLAGLELIDAEYTMSHILVFHVGQLFLHLEVAAIGILISACTKKVNVGIGLGIALLFYFMDMMSRVLEQLKACKYITPFYYANASDVVIKGEIDLTLLAIGVGVMVACILSGCILYNNRDLAA